MKRPRILRRPLKPLLHMLLLTLLTAAALVFSLQYLLDGLVLKHCIQTYAYIGSLHNESSTEPLPQELVSMLQNSKNVETLELRASYAAKLTGAQTVPDFMMSNQQLSQHYFIEATVLSNQSWPQDTPVVYEYYAVCVDRQWGSSSIARTSMILTLRRHQSDEALKPGQKIFFIGDFVKEYNAVRSDRTSVTTPRAWEEYGVDYSDNPIKMNPLIVLPDGVNSEEFILNFMEETDILPLFQHYSTLENQTTVREISDLNLLPYGANGRIYVDMGRALNDSDRGKNVCMISQGMFLRNRLRVGDTITLRLSDGCFTLPNGYESGLPFETQTTALDFGQEITYEIVGIYHQYARDLSDPLFYNVSDILIPPLETANAPLARSYNCSFRILGTQYDAFLSEFEPILSDFGYKLKLTDLGWEDAEDSFYAMSNRRTLMLVCAIAAFAAAAVCFAVLTHQHYRYDYALRRLMGAYKKEAGMVIYAGFGLSAVPGAVLAGACAWLVYLQYLRPSVLKSMPITLPSAGEITLIMALCLLAELAVSFGLTLLLRGRTERRGILKLLR